MATIHTSGTQLENQRAQLPLNKVFLASLAVVFLLAMHFLCPTLEAQASLYPLIQPLG